MKMGAGENAFVKRCVRHCFISQASIPRQSSGGSIALIGGIFELVAEDTFFHRNIA
jgi:hypothetical protein